MVDGVPLALVDQAHQVRELHRDRAAGVEQHLHAGNEVVEIRNVGEHVVAEQEIGAPARRVQPPPSRRRRNPQRWYARLPAPRRRRWRRVRCRARESRGRESTAAGSRRWRRSRRRYARRRGQAHQSSDPRSACNGRASSSRTRRSRRSRRRCPPRSRTARAAPAGSFRRRRRAAGRTAPSRWPARRRHSCWRAASCRGRRIRPRGHFRRSGRKDSSSGSLTPRPTGGPRSIWRPREASAKLGREAPVPVRRACRSSRRVPVAGDGKVAVRR